MTENNRVVVVEDDPFARDQLLNLLSRDWRTRVVGEFEQATGRKASSIGLGIDLLEVDMQFFDAGKRILFAIAGFDVFTRVIVDLMITLGVTAFDWPADPQAGLGPLEVIIV